MSVEAGGTGKLHATAEQVAASLGPDVSVGEPIVAHGRTIIPLVRVTVSTREATGALRAGAITGEAITAEWQSEPVALIIVVEGQEPTVVLLSPPSPP